MKENGEKMKEKRKQTKKRNKSLLPRSPYVSGIFSKIPTPPLYKFLFSSINCFNFLGPRPPPPPSLPQEFPIPSGGGMNFLCNKIMVQLSLGCLLLKYTPLIRYGIIITVCEFQVVRVFLMTPWKI